MSDLHTRPAPTPADAPTPPDDHPRRRVGTSSGTGGIRATDPGHCDVVVVDPSSSGVSLVEALVERGAAVTALWHPERAHLDRLRGVPTLHTADDHASTLAAVAACSPRHVVAGSEYAVQAAERLASDLGLPANDPRHAVCRRDKGAMIARVAACGIPVGMSVEVTSRDRAAEVLRDRPVGPLIVKPKDGAGSDGVTLCRDPEQALAAVDALLAGTNFFGAANSSVLLQEYLEGDQFIVNTVSVGGVHHVTDMMVYDIDDSGAQPLILSSIGIDGRHPQAAAITAYVVRCLDALGITDGAGHTEVRVTPAGPRLIEVNARLMGPVLPVDTFAKAYGYSQATVQADALTARAHGIPALLAGPKRTLAVTLLRIGSTGTVRAMPGIDRIRRLPGFDRVCSLPALGQHVTPVNQTTNGTTGLVFFVHDDAGVVAQAVSAVREMEDADAIYDIA